MEEAVWAQLGPWGLVSVFVMMVALGRLIPRWTHNQRIADRDKQIEILQKTLDKRDEQIDTLIKQHEVSVRLLEDIKREAVVRRGATR